MNKYLLALSCSLLLISSVAYADTSYADKGIIMLSGAEALDSGKYNDKGVDMLELTYVFSGKSLLTETRFYIQANHFHGNDYKNAVNLFSIGYMRGYKLSENISIIGKAGIGYTKKTNELLKTKGQLLLGVFYLHKLTTNTLLTIGYTNTRNEGFGAGDTHNNNRYGIAGIGYSF